MNREEKNKFGNFVHEQRKKEEEVLEICQDIFANSRNELAVSMRYFQSALSALKIVPSGETHTANVRLVTEEDRGNGITKPRPYTDVDGMITNVPGLVLATFYADCVPLYFIDPVHRAIGLSHSGWRGTVAKIGEVTVRRMQEEFGSDPSEIYGAVGPSICQDCYEVSEDVIEQFRAAFPQDKWDALFYGKPDGKYQLDLWEANHQIMLGAGLKEEHISMPNLCTCCNPEFLFSHRASHGRRGNLGAFLGIR